MKLRYALLPLCLLATLPLSAGARGLDVRDLVALDRVSSPILTPDGGTVVFAKRVVDGELKASTSLWMRNLRTRDNAPPRQLTPEGWNVNSASLAPDGEHVYFLSANSGTQQVYRMSLGGGEPEQITAYPLDVGSYKISPDGKKVLFSMSVFPDCNDATSRTPIDCTVERLEQQKKVKSSGVLHDSMFVRHWDTWEDGRLNWLFWTYATPKSKAQTPAHSTFLVTPDHVNAPSKPFGDAGEYTWAPDSERIVYSAKPTPGGALDAIGRTQSWSTNFDLYLYGEKANRKPEHGLGNINLTFDDRAEAGATIDRKGRNRATDTGPVFSADGKTLYYRAMKRPGFEADRFGLMARDMATGETREIAPQWDRSADGLVLSPDGKSIYTTAQDMGEHPLFKVDIATGNVTKVVGEGSVTAFDIAGNTLAFTRNTLSSGDQLFTTDLAAQAPLRAITPSAGEVLPEVKFGEFEQFSFKGWNDETVHGYVVKPHNYQDGKTYPVAFLIHGGPQGSFGNSWSYRWNPQTYAGQGFAVVMIDFHGSTGYGQAFTDAISQHWGDRPLEDLKKGWAAAQQKYPFLQGDNACALGASYGGYMINWIASQWNDGFKCLVNHNGVFDTRSMGAVTEELWFTEWEFGGPLYAKPEGYEAFNPARHIDKWKTPMLVVAGQNDFRVPLDQSLSTFHTLQRRGIDSQLLYFPDENHWVLKPHNSVQWHDTVNAWLNKHLSR